MKVFTIIFYLLLSTFFLSGQTLRPYLQSATDHSVWVGWKTTSDTTSLLLWGDSPDQLTHSIVGSYHTFATNYLWHKAKIEDLQPNTAYYYKVITGSQESAVYRFRTYQAPGTPGGHVRVLIVGDTQHPTTATRTFLAAKQKLQEKYGTNLEDHLHLILKQGDNVDAGVLAQYSSMHFDPLSVLSGNIPTMTVVGNHEYYQNSDLSYFFPHFEYDDIDLIYNDITGGNAEHYYAFRVGGALFCMLNSNEWWATQTNWLQQVVEAANADPDIRFIFGTAHHPLRCENWVSDGSAYIRDQIMPVLRTSEKTAMYTSGHSHMYARGSSRDSAVWEMISGGGGLIQNWNENQELDYPDVQRSFDVWTYQIMDLDLEAGTMDVETYSIGNEEYLLNNIPIDTFHRYFGKLAPMKPTMVAPMDTLVNLPYTFSGSPFVSPAGELANSTEFEVAGASGDFETDKIFSLKRDFENYYQIVSPAYFSPIDQMAGVNMFEVTLDSTQVYKGKNWIRVRYRDRNLEWSAWSDSLPFEASNGREPLPYDPIAWWRFNGNAHDTTGHGFDGVVPPAGVLFVPDHPVRGTVAVFDNTTGIPVRTGALASEGLPKVQMTVSGWVKMNSTDTWGGFIGCLQDNGSYERGWVLGTRNQRFSFALVSESTNAMTYLEDVADFNFGQWYYLTATYNGQVMKLFVDGELHASTTAQQGDITYALYDSDWFGIGSYVDLNENTPHHGALDELVLWARALSDQEVMSWYKQVSNLAPTVSLNAPLNNATFVAPATITVSATAGDQDGTVGLMEFYNGTQKLFEDTDGPPYSFIWENVPAGVHTITAKATDNQGAFTVSQPVEVIVLVNVPPSIVLLSPENGTMYAEPALITIIANPVDVDGQVVSVEFFNGAEKIGADDDGVPFFMNWLQVEAGTYYLRALATDNNGGTTWADSVKVIVTAETSTQTAGTQSVVLFPNPTTGWVTIQTHHDLGQADLRLYSPEGILMFQSKMNKAEADLTGVPAGAYRMEIRAKNGSILGATVLKL
ncbi:MAG: fibronectin type III domain-containing protein [Saprospiraceae bacterium]|nr:fibronectin type III domain-containing protein [Saprospiraceae bacterium]